LVEVEQDEETVSGEQPDLARDLVEVAVVVVSGRRLDRLVDDAQPKPC
jgi:hypothetical protein